MNAWLQRPAVPLFVLLFGAYAYFHQGGGWNQNVRLDLVRSIVERGSFRLDAYHANTRDLACRGPEGRCRDADSALDRHFYCDKAPGTSWLAVPAAALLDRIEGRPERPRALNRRLYLLRLWSVGAVSALAAAMLPGLLRRLRVPTGIGIACALAYALATLVFPYATLFYGHAPAASLLLMVFALLVRAREAGQRAARSDRLAGLLGGCAVAVEYPAALALAALGLYAVAVRRSIRPGLRIALGAAGPILALAAYHTAAFGGPFKLPYEFSIAPDRAQGWMGLGAPDPAALLQLSFGPFRGLFYSAPWLLLAAPGAYHLARRSNARAEVALCAGIALAFFWMNASLVDWAGGWTLGPRYLVPALPFLALLAGGGGAWIAESWSDVRARVAAAVAAVLLAASALFMLAGVAVQPLVPIEVRQPFADFLLPALFEGRLALNPLGAHAAIPDPDVPRQAWNFGQRLGLSGLASLLPLIGFAAVAGAWLALAVRRADRPAPPGGSGYNRRAREREREREEPA